jgi:hypothetical protein
MTTTKKCIACGQYFKPWPQTPDQTYCSKAECQRERRRRAKLRERQAKPRATSKSSGDRTSSPLDYWRDYRADHPDYVDRNRLLQKDRNLRRTLQSKTNGTVPLPPGRYRLERLDGDSIANGAVWIVEIRFLSVFSRDG